MVFALSDEEDDKGRVWAQVDLQGDGVADGYVHASYLRACRDPRLHAAIRHRPAFQARLPPRCEIGDLCLYRFDHPRQVTS